MKLFSSDKRLLIQLSKTHILILGFIFIFLFSGINSIYFSLKFAFGADAGTYIFRGDLLADYFKVIFSYPTAYGVVHERLESLPFVLKDYAINNPYQGVSAFLSGELSHFHMTPFTTLLSLLNIVAFKPFGIVNTFAIVVCGVFCLTYYALKNVSNGKLDRFFIFLIAISSYPFIFALQRGNFFSLISTLFIILAVSSHLKKNLYRCVLFVSIAINIRPNLLVFVPFFFLLSKEPIKYIFSLGVFCGALFSISISICNYIYPDYTLLNFLEGLKIYEKIYVTGDGGWGFNTSLFNVIKFLSKFFGISFRASLVNIIVSALMLMMISYAIYIFKKKRMYPFEFLYILASITMLGTPVFADYHLLIFISPIFFLVSTHGASFRFELSKDSLVPLIFIISCLMLSPLNYYEFQGFYVASAIKTVVAFLSCLFIFKVAGQRKDDLVV